MLLDNLGPQIYRWHNFRNQSAQIGSALSGDVWIKRLVHDKYEFSRVLKIYLCHNFRNQSAQLGSAFSGVGGLNGYSTIKTDFISVGVSW